MVHLAASVVLPTLPPSPTPDRPPLGGESDAPESRPWTIFQRPRWSRRPTRAFVRSWPALLRSVRKSATTLASELRDDELAFLLEIIKTSRFRGKHLEIGTGAGGTLCQMIKCFENDVNPPFVVVDRMTYFPNQLEIVKENLINNNINPLAVDIRVSKSTDAFVKAEKACEQFDFIVIDGAHKIRYITQDLRWTRLLRVGGIVCLHDYHSRERGVFVAVNRFLKRHKNYKEEGFVGTLLVLRKTEKSLAPEITKWDGTCALLLGPLFQLERNLRKRLW